MFSTVKNVHFVGIGGIGMSGIAEILLSQGYTVSGSDAAESDNTLYLRSLGAQVSIGHHAENITGAEVVVYSSAIKRAENPETLAAAEHHIPVIRRAEMLAEVSRLNYSLAIAGTHGKTTTTSLCGTALMHAGLDPTVIVGGRLRGLGGSNARLGKGIWTVVEADEYDRSFLQLQPTIALITNIEAEHLDIYSDLDDIKTTFLQFAERVPFYGAVIVCGDDSNVQSLIPRINKKLITYGFAEHCDLRASNCRYSERSSSCDVYFDNKLLGELQLQIPGSHNVSNALAAVAVANLLGIDFRTIVDALGEFGGVMRRFEILGEWRGVMIVDDYAHHHTEISATLAAARKGWQRRLVAVFQPHTYTRTRDFVKEFGGAFGDADVVVVCDVYRSREQPIEGIHGGVIADSIRSHGHSHVHYVADKTEVASFLNTILQPNDMVITLGAGDVYKIGLEVRDALAKD